MPWMLFVVKGEGQEVQLTEFWFKNVYLICFLHKVSSAMLASSVDVDYLNSQWSDVFHHFSIQMGEEFLLELIAVFSHVLTMLPVINLL